MSNKDVRSYNKVMTFYLEAIRFFDLISESYDLVEIGAGDHQLAYRFSQHEQVKSITTIEPLALKKADYYSRLIKKPLIRIIERVEKVSDFPKEAFLVGLHLCGDLTDKLISVAQKNNSPFIVQTCCHTQRNLENYAYIMRGESIQRYQSVGHFIDEARLRKVRDEGFKAGIRWLPITSRENRVILGVPS